MLNQPADIAMRQIARKTRFFQYNIIARIAGVITAYKGIELSAKRIPAANDNSRGSSGV